jgi:ATPase subunit of ABC transporter with duplicated ATPase domains
VHSIRFASVSFGYDDTRPILDDVTLHIGAGFHGIVGGNGAGKSTLLALARGALSPRSGRVQRSSDSLRFAHVPQSADEATDLLRAFSLREDRTAARWRGALDVDVHTIERFATLSPGERMRWHFAAALAEEPDVLLLDEPTSHVDEDARTRVLSALARFEGIGLLVSHDRSWLDALCAHTVWLENGKVRSYAGGYSAAKEARAREHEAARTARDDAKADIARRTRVVHERERARAGAELMRSGKRRQRNEHDSDARGILASTRVAWAEARLGRTARVERAGLERAQSALATLAPVQESRGRDFLFEAVENARPIALCLDGVDVRAGSSLLFRDVHLTLRRGERVRLEGSNGAGKTSLLRALASTRSQGLLYVPQEIDAAETRTRQRMLAALAPDLRGRAYQRLAALGCDPALVARSPSPSPGEARKLALATELARPVEVMLLDEPTNHLDLPSVERLERALRGFSGALVVVTHDARFAESLSPKTWSITPARTLRV